MFGRRMDSFFEVQLVVFYVVVLKGCLFMTRKDKVKKFPQLYRRRCFLLGGGVASFVEENGNRMPITLFFCLIGNFFHLF